VKGDRSRPCSIYIIINIINGKRYIGVTTLKNLESRLRQHFYSAKNYRNNGHFYRAIRKHGEKVFIINKLKACASATEGLAEEVRLIKELKPEYNSTAGGTGRLNGYISEEGRQRIRAAQLGIKRRLGAILTPEARARISKAQETPEAIGRWNLYRSMGPKSSSRRVLCVSDNSIYESASAAAKKYQVCKSAIIELCLGKRGRRTVGGLKFRYLEN
jgi:group I intron endonuclease